MPSSREMPIPKSRSEAVFQWVITAIVVCFALLAVINLYSGQAPIASVLWLAFVVAMLWSSARAAGGRRRFLINLMGDLLGRRFAEWHPAEAEPRWVHFGFQLFNRRFVQKSIRIDSIESVVWNTGQASHMAGREMNDWHIWIWLDDDPARTGQQHYGVGPAGRKERTEALGLSFISFLRSAGADLVQGEIPTCFVRAPQAEMKSSQPVQ